MGNAATLLGHLHGAGHVLVRHLPQVGTIGEVFIHVVVGVEGWFLGEEADVLFGFHGMLAGVETVDVDGALGLVEDAADDVHRGRLARPVGTQ